MGNKSIEWLRRPNPEGRPFFLYFGASHPPLRQFGAVPLKLVQIHVSPTAERFGIAAPHCPHDPADPADWYADACAGVTAPRIPNFNWTAPGFHELIARQPPLTDSDALLIDDFARRRCQCLMSVDDAHAAIVAETKAMGVFDKTYFVITSDHGYNLGVPPIPLPVSGFVVCSGASAFICDCRSPAV